ncbi:MAG: OmpA family protein [Leptospiraceae bacterium]|nr:OmpA family protein [Leptospiraceae bacterium]MCP5499455.1 OmpA family protein [Leptospiraceae bacterium]
MKQKKYLSIILIIFITISLGFCKSSTKKADKPGEIDNKENTGTEGKTEDSKDGNEVKERTNEATDKTDTKEGTEGTKEDGSTKEGTDLTDVIPGNISKEVLERVNTKLEKLRYPDGEVVKGFGYKMVSLPSKALLNRWVKEHKDEINLALSKLPKKYKLQLKGHTDASGPKDAEGSKKGNIYYSKKRAEAVMKALVDAGFSSDRMVTVGVASDELIPDVDDRSALQRRVTFKIIDTESGGGGSESDSEGKESNVDEGKEID